MTEEHNEQLPTRRGFPVWAHNPSISKVDLREKDIPLRLESRDTIMLINKETGELLGHGTAGFFKREIVDSARFMKVYMGQLQILFDLTKTAQHIFMIVWDQVQNNKDQDKILLKPVMAKIMNKDISERVFQKGVRELLKKEFLYMSPIDGIYYINMGIFFNGNRIIAATEYIKKSSLSPAEQKTINQDNSNEKGE